MDSVVRSTDRPNMTLAVDRGSNKQSKKKAQKSSVTTQALIEESAKFLKPELKELLRFTGWRV